MAEDLNLYLSSAGDEEQFALVDEFLQEQVRELEQQGISPAAIAAALVNRGIMTNVALAGQVETAQWLAGITKTIAPGTTPGQDAEG